MTSLTCLGKGSLGGWHVSLTLKVEGHYSLEGRCESRGEGKSILGRDKSTCKGPGVGKTSVHWKNQTNAHNFSKVESVAPFQAHLARKWRMEACPLCHPLGLMACSPLGVCLCKEVRMDHLSGLGRLGSAGRMWSVCIFCLCLKFASLQIHA